MKYSRKISMLAVLALMAMLSGPAAAQWCGENGVIRFSFSEGDSIVSLAQVEPENGVVQLTVYAWLTDVVPVKRDGDAFLSTGGFEFELEVEGARAYVTGKSVPIDHLDMGKTNESLIVGLNPGLTLMNGRVLLAQWSVMFQGKPEDVVFRLRKEPGHSCKTVAGCAECGSPALYIGVEGSEQLTCFFGAGYVPAYLNPTGEIDTTPVHGNCTFEDVGVFERR